MRLPDSGLHIALDGPEAAGKTTQLDMLHMGLYRTYPGIFRARESGSTEIGELIRLALEENLQHFTPEEIMTLFAAQRMLLYHTHIRPTLAADGLVLSDRCALTGLVYQGYASVPSFTQAAELRRLTSYSIRDKWPDLIILLDVPVELTLARLAKRRKLTSYDSFDRGFHTRVREGYHIMAAKEFADIVVIDGTGPEAVVQARIRAAITHRFNLTFLD